MAFGLHSFGRMSRLAGLLVLVLGSVAIADTTEAPRTEEKTAETAPAAKSSKFPLRVVKILSDSEQALLFDQKRGRHVLVEVGDTVGDYTISAIGADEVTLAGTDMPVEVVLSTVDKPKPAAKKPAKAAPADPYADATTAPADPYADAITAPADPYEEPELEKPVRAVTWGAPKSEGEKATPSPFAGIEPPAPTPDVAKRGSMSKTDAVEEPAAIEPTPAKPAATKPSKPSKADEAAVLADAMTAARATPAIAQAKLTKKDVQAALADFGALAASIDAVFGAKGLEIKEVQAGSVFAKAGLEAGDVITAVDGKPLRTLDDAADLYARAGTIKTANVQVVRGGKAQTLRVSIQ